MASRVGVMLVQDLTRVLDERPEELPASAVFWLRSEQFSESDGVLTIIPDRISDLKRFSNENCLEPLGLVAVQRNGRVDLYFNDVTVSAEHADYAKRLVDQLARLWAMRAITAGINAVN